MTTPTSRPATENELRDMLIGLLNEGCASALVALLPPSLTGPPIPPPTRWTGETPIGFNRWRVDGVGRTDSGAATVVIETKIDFRFLAGQAWGYAKWQQGQLEGETNGVLTFIVPERRRAEIVGHIASDLREGAEQHDVRSATHADGLRTVIGPPDIGIVVLSWDEVAVAVWSAVAQRGDDGTVERALRFWDECARSRAATVRAVSPDELDGRPDAASYLKAVVDGIVEHAATIAGTPSYRSNPAHGGFRDGYRYLGDGPATFAVGVRNATGGSPIWVRVVLKSAGAAQVKNIPGAEQDETYIWVPVPIAPTDSTVAPQLIPAAEWVAELVARTHL
ncbi:MAG: hypothetical protein DLM57_09875 [Pseudonocardiales bacterium]|nr:MAG: hypothetical protein DLM57_09875 [Pseudonocardiales bacterium]